jgi:hypothetical protein
MSAFDYTAAEKTTAMAGSGAELVDEFGVFTAAGIDEARKRDAATPIQGEKYFKTKNVDKNNYSNQGMNNIGLAQLNSDGDNLPIDKKSVGFNQVITNYTMRQSMMITRELLETDRYGVVGDHSRSLVHSARKTIERILADPFNRGFGTTSLGVLAEDGLGFFSAARPQPKSSAGTWSNLEATGALTPDALATARVNFRKYLDGSGDLDPQIMQKVIVSADQEDTMREIVGTNLKVDTSLNNTNIVSDVAYEVWDWLDDGIVAFCGDAENDLQFHIRKAPGVIVFQDGTNPDKIWSRMRMAMGTGLLRPGKYRGLTVS